MTKPIERYRDRVMGCWLGKAVGGTLGMPHEGVDGPLNLSFYDPVPTGMVANDDLDLQVLWACKLAEMPRPTVDRARLGRAFVDHVQFPWDEYGVCIRNIKAGLMPPLSGSHDNWFHNGLGAAIRTELWACLAAGDADLAATYAYEDACIDHAGEGIWAAVFFAALEAAAFVESDCETLLDTATVRLPVTSLVRRCVTDTRLWWDQTRDWLEVRRRILADYGHENFTDVTMNAGFTVLGWLAGEGDFGRSICVANNCGRDTDCTAATIGALFGIIDPDGIPPKWVEPIGRSLVVDQRIIGIHPPDSLEGFTDLVLSLRERLDYRRPPQAVPAPTRSVPGIRVEVGFVSDKSLSKNTVPASTATPRSVVLPGTIAGWPADRFEGHHLVLRYTLTLASPQRMRVVFNSPQENRVWMDGHFLFGREGGRMCPALHRPPMNQFADLDLTAGRYTLTATVARPPTGAAAWVVAIGDAVTHQWVDVFERDAAE